MKSSLLIERIDSAIRFFLYILIFWLPYSPAVIEICVILCFILWLVKRGILARAQVRRVHTSREKLFVISKTIKPRPTFLNVPVAWFLAACLLSVMGSVLLGQSLHNFFTKTLEWFVIYFLVVEVFKDKKHVYIAIAIFAFTAFSTVIDSFIQFYITNKDIFNGHIIELGGRVTAGFRTPNGLGGYLAGIVPGLSAWILLGKQKLRWRLIALLILSLTVWSLFLTFSRGAWLGVFFGGIFLISFVLFPKGRARFYFSSGLFLAITILCVGFLLILVSNNNQELLGRNETIQYRLSVWRDNITMIKDRLFFGHGINTFMRIFQEYRKDLFMGPTYAHNCYIQLTAETGIVGLFCFLWIIAELFRQSLAKIKSAFTQDRNLGVLIVGLLSGIFAFLVHSFFDTNFYSLQLSAYLWVMVGLLVSIDKILDASKVRKGVVLEKQ